MPLGSEMPSHAKFIFYNARTGCGCTKKNNYLLNMKESLINKIAYHGFCYNVSNFKPGKSCNKMKSLFGKNSQYHFRAQFKPMLMRTSHANIKIISFMLIVKHFSMINWRQLYLVANEQQLLIF